MRSKQCAWLFLHLFCSIYIISNIFCHHMCSELQHTSCYVTAIKVREALAQGDIMRRYTVNPGAPAYVEVLWGIDADPKVLVALVSLVMSDLTQPRILGYVRPDITESWEVPGYVRPDITESWELSVMSDLTQPRILGYVRPDVTESWELSVMSDLT